MKILSKQRQFKILIALIVCIIMIACAFGYRMMHKEEIDSSKQIQIENQLKVFSAMYYETDFYSKQTKEQLENYASEGIKVTLKELKEFNDSNTDSMCDEDNTYVTIYPESPFGVNDYTIKYTIGY